MYLTPRNNRLYFLQLIMEKPQYMLKMQNFKVVQTQEADQEELNTG